MELEYSSCHGDIARVEETLKWVDQISSQNEIVVTRERSRLFASALLVFPDSRATANMAQPSRTVTQATYHPGGTVSSSPLSGNPIKRGKKLIEIVGHITVPPPRTTAIPIGQCGHRCGSAGIHDWRVYVLDCRGEAGRFRGSPPLRIYCRVSLGGMADPA